MKKIIVSSMTAFVCLLTFTVGAFAKTGPVSGDQAVWNKARQNVLGLMDEGKLSTIVRPTVKAERQEVKADRCEMVTSRINARLNLYNNNKDNFNHRYEQYKTVVMNKVAAWKAKGCDTATVDADLPVLTTKLSDFGASFRDFVTSLQGSRSYVCGLSQGKFVGQVNDAHQKQLVMKQKAVALRDFVINTLRPHVKAVRQACEPKTTSAPKITGVTNETP